MTHGIENINNKKLNQKNEIEIPQWNSLRTGIQKYSVSNTRFVLAKGRSVN